MFKHILFAFTLSLISITSAQAAVEIGQSAPDFTATTISGETVRLSDLQGQPVVLEWTNHECPYVMKHYDTENMQAAQKEATEEDGAVWLTIVSSAEGKQGHVSDEKAAEIITQQGAHPTAKIMDSSGEIGQTYGAKTTPHMFVINAEGKIVYAGAIDDNPSPRHETVEGAKNYVLATLDSLSAGKPVEPSQTAPYGCSVKY